MTTDENAINVLPMYQSIRSRNLQEADELTQHSAWKRRICLLVYASIMLFGISSSGVLDQISSADQSYLSKQLLSKVVLRDNDEEDPFTPRIIRETIEVSDLINES
mmetsp:Transcript_13172/g.20083  ORF Transcript_13172/g.20083 Transcript_13172/m.20083 type:complete len:106 (-) Transcript_13172:191-508(-)|eukprot:CAMPEP_0178907014 /NCGR_PEP_ID=MMETSP0786-20121207/7135_1 /TAXON_ID=186022 /ORGANISM="Thalassionema frauenfeldii, Strain CCMP 1798" /LENGTH=105 /DNA_ID=CAMNT_0020578765 /DNA_START=589 /DNA_END=906 /DNA_ORIENTATION=-